MKIVKHPLIHFLLGGAALVALFAWLQPGEAGPADAGGVTVHIGSGEAAWLQETWSRQWQRPATRDEMMGLVTNYLKEELLAREARELGLEKDDTLVRRRLAQKMSFLLEDTFRLAEPSEAELRAYFEANATRYERGSRVSFGHIFFDPEKRANAEADAHAALAYVNATHAQSPTEPLGDRLLIESPIVDADRAAIAAQFGEAFADAVLVLSEGAWQGPISSAYGYHLVYVDEKSAVEPATLTQARSRVEEDWYREHQRREIEKYFAGLMEKYRVETDPDVRGMIGPLDELLPQAIGEGTAP